MRRIILSSVACLSLNIFPHYLINGTIIGKKITEHKMCVLIFSTTLSETFLIIRRTESDNITIHIHTYVHTYIHTYIHTCVHTYIHTYVRKYTRTFVRTDIHTYVRMYIRTYTHTYMHTHTYIHTYIHTMYTGLHVMYRLFSSDVNED